jgi:hypothetical protein
MAPTLQSLAGEIYRHSLCHILIAYTVKSRSGLAVSGTSLAQGYRVMSPRCPSFVYPLKSATGVEM